MPTPKDAETRYIEKRTPRSRARRQLDRRSFLKASAAAVGAAVGIAAALSPEGVAVASEELSKERRKKAASAVRSLSAARCPVTGERVSKNASTDYKGATLYFSSTECIDKFKSDRIKYEVAANAQLVLTGQYTQVQCPLSKDDFVPALKMKVCGVDVHFCSSECLKKVKRASADERAELVFREGFDRAFVSKQEQTAGASPAGNKWSCVVCGYVHTGSAPPAKCPKCGAKSDSFVRQKS